MSRAKLVLGFWLSLILFAVIFPWGFYLVSSFLDELLALPSVIPTPYNAILGAFLALFGLFWILWAYSFLNFIGKGSPIEVFGYALYPTRYLVITGPYAYTRNPMVFGLLFVLLGMAVYTRSLAGLALIPLLTLGFAVYVRLFEEPPLVKRFGEEYTRYRKSVPLLIPRLSTIERPPYTPNEGDGDSL